MTAPDLPSARVVEQRIRNRIIEVLDLSASYEAQARYQDEVPWICVVYEVINQWDDQVPPGWLDKIGPPVFTSDEIAAMRAFGDVHSEVAAQVLDDFPSLEGVQSMPYWSRLAAAAREALAVFQRRGRLDEEVELRDP